MHHYDYIHYAWGQVNVFLNAYAEVWVCVGVVDCIYVPGFFISWMTDLESQCTAEVYQ